MTVNVVLAAGKFTAGVLGNSHALIADAVESLADIFSSIIVWRGIVVAAEPPDREHPYGHGKAEPIAAAIVAAMLFMAAAGIISRSIQAFAEPRPRPELFTLFVLLGVVVIKEALFRFVAREANTVESVVVYTDAWHHRSDAITSLVAATGIMIALAGGGRFAVADDVAAIVAALIIAWNGLRLLRPALNELMDTSVNKELIAQITKTAAATPGVRGVEKCLARKAGNQVLVDMHVEVDPEISVRAGHAIAHAVKSNVMDKIPSVRDVLVHIEPEPEKPRS
jgi:cation diffusion facilitator family transporter